MTKRLIFFGLIWLVLSHLITYGFVTTFSLSAPVGILVLLATMLISSEPVIFLAKIFFPPQSQLE